MIDIVSDGVSAPAEEQGCMRAGIENALLHENRSGDVCLMLVDEQTIQTLNRDFRHVDAVTDVLTFPAWEGEGILTPPDGYLGDIAVCLPRAVRQAESYGHSLRRELTFLAVHGALHLLGYDHMTTAQETEMFSLQDTILNEMGITE